MDEFLERYKPLTLVQEETDLNRSIVSKQIEIAIKKKKTNFPQRKSQDQMTSLMNSEALSWYQNGERHFTHTHTAVSFMAIY